ncbi:MAG: hypothetical protein Q8R92_05385 [Deltaproteobacteria bacterium]|nr:hypothetical protein [Deltaproteobacteria bacterium]
MATYYPHGVNVDKGELQIGGTAVSATAAALNVLSGDLSESELAYLDAVSPGTVTAEKAVVVDENKTIDTLTVTDGTVTTLDSTTATIATADVVTFGGTTITAGTLIVDGETITNPLESDTAGKAVAAVGGTAITGAGTVASGLTTVDQVVASLANVGTAEGDPFIVTAVPEEGDMIVNVYQDDGTDASNAGTVHLIAYGDA